MKTYKGGISLTNIVFLFVMAIILFAFAPIITSTIDDCVAGLVANPNDATALTVTVIRFIPYLFIGILMFALVIWAIPRREPTL